MKKVKKGETAKKAEKLTISIVVLSIIALILMSLLPWISVKENDFVKEDLHFNFEMMRKSTNDQIGELVSDLNLINISFCALIILGLLSFLGATIHASGKFSVLGYIMLLVGCITLIFSILVIDLQLVILEKIGKMDTISASAIFSPLYYAYILLIPSILILIFSVSYTWAMSSHSIQKFKVLKEEKKDKEMMKKSKIKHIKKISKTKVKEPEKEEEPEEKTSELEKQQPSEEESKEEKTVEPEIDEKREEMEQWLTGKVLAMEKQAVKEKSSGPEEEKEEEPAILEQPTFEEKPSDIEEEEQKKSIQRGEKISPEPQKELKETPVFSPEKTKEKSKESDELRASQSFEKALSSAIQKKQTDIERLEPLEPEDDGVEEKPEEEEKISPQIEEPVKKKFNIRCPQCKHIFITETEEGKITKIKCPKCGKEGVVR